MPELRLLAKPAAPPTPAPEPTLRLELPAPRCPYCHDDVRADQAQHGCSGCRAWHHAACWSEARATCAACGRKGLWLPQRRTPGQWDLFVGWVFLVLVIPASQALVLPAFDAMFSEVGCRLPVWTQLALSPWRWALTSLPLSTLFLAALATDRRVRRGWSVATALLTGALIGVYAVALFLPLVTLITHI